MKKLIYVSMLVVSAGALSSFTTKHDTVATKQGVTTDRVGIGHADDRVGIGHADDRVGIGHADDRVGIGHADDRVGIGHAD